MALLFPKTTTPRPTRGSRGSKDEKAYFSFIHELPCAVSGRYPVQVAHLSSAARQYGHYGRGKGMKVHFRWTLPLHPELHAEQHAGNEMAFWRNKGIDPHLLALKLFGLWSEYGADAIESARSLLRDTASTASFRP